ncbi:MAG TPA: hypothetical protein VMW17_20410 [Candidatus Binatia bacterium]|nr:hypothetical protein [Candidatus Binatia bacterium]
MSEYFRVLKRIEGTQPERDVPTTARVMNRNTRDTATSTAVARPRPAAPSPRSTSRRDETSAAFVTLFDNIRALGEGQPVRTLVFAGASSAEAVRTVTTGLAAHVESVGLRVLMAELADVGGRPILRSRTRDADLHPGAGDEIPPDLGGKAAPAELTDWLEGAGTVADFIIIEGRPLAESIDAALLARACDGLVIIAQSEVTLREALRLAAQRAQTVGCRTLGVVLQSRRDRWPRWLRRFIGDNH